MTGHSPMQNANYCVHDYAVSSTYLVATTGNLDDAGAVTITLQVWSRLVFSRC